MRCATTIFLLIFGLMATATSAQIIDNFDSGDLSAWNITAPYYTTLSLAAPGAGGTGNALAIQEATGTQGGHSASALAHRVFAAPVNWNGYTTLEFDAKISSGTWNGYSVAVNNAGRSTLLRGIHSNSVAGSFETFRFDISGVARDQVDEIIFYVNKTGQNSGQILNIDNIKLSNTPVSTPDTNILENFTAGDISRWVEAASHNYNVNPTIFADAAPNGNVVNLALTATAPSSYCTWMPTQTMDWYDYKTLEFDAKLATGTVTDGFSIRIYSGGNPAVNNVPGTSLKIRKFVPSTTSYVTCQVDISGLQRDQISTLMFYVNRTSANAGQVVRIDNIKLTKTPVPATPDVVWLDNFDTYADTTALQLPWDWAQASAQRVLNTTDAVSAPNSIDMQLINTSNSAYVRRTWTIAAPPLSGTLPTQDWGDYKSLMFDVKVIKGDPTAPNYPVGFSATVYNAVGTNDLLFFPSGYDNWETIALDITPYEFDQIKQTLFYINRSKRNDTNQIVRIDNIRLSKEPAPQIVVDDPNVDNFEDGNMDDWYYVSRHTVDTTTYPGVTRELVTDAAGGSHYALKITCLNPPASTSAYAKKTMDARWGSYKTLTFDAKMANSTTSQGFSVAIVPFSGSQAEHQFCPTTEWKTFKINIASDPLSEVVGLSFYVNRGNGLGISQNGNQELYIDNIRLSTQAVQTTFSTVGEAKTQDDGATVVLDGKITTGYLPAIAPDKADPTIPRDVFFIEEPNRSSAIPVVVGANVTPWSPIAAGTKVKVTGTMITILGTRYLYANSVTIQGTGFAVPNPIGLTNKACGSGMRGLDEGVEGFYGPDTTGMLASIFGEVKSIGMEATGAYILYVDDGSGVPSDMGTVGIKIDDTKYIAMNVEGFNDTYLNKYVRITGFVMNVPEIDTNGQYTGKICRRFWPRLDASYTPDISTINH